MQIVGAGMLQIFDFPESLYFGLIQLKFSVLINIHATGVKCKENPSKLLDSFFNATSSTAFLKGMHWVFVVYNCIFTVLICFNDSCFNDAFLNCCDFIIFYVPVFTDDLS